MVLWYSKILKYTKKERRGKQKSLIGKMQMRHTYKVEKNAFSTIDNYFFSFDEPNEKGEIIQAEITKVENDGSKHNLINILYKKGLIKEPLKDYWLVKTYVVDKKGNCWGKYNPQILPIGTKISPKWVLEATEENKQKILEEIELMAYQYGIKSYEKIIGENTKDIYKI